MKLLVAVETISTVVVDGFALLERGSLLFFEANTTAEDDCAVNNEMKQMQIAVGKMTRVT